MIVHVMRFFSMSLSEVLGIKKRHFYWLHSQVRRVMAMEAKRQLELHLSTQNGENLKHALDALEQDIGIEVEFSAFIPPKFEHVTEDGLDPAFDRSALRALKARHGA